MKVTISLESIWTMLQSLSLSSHNKEWLAARLIESCADETRAKQEKMVTETLGHAYCETKQAIAAGQTMPNAYDLLNEI